MIIIEISSVVSQCSFRTKIWRVESNMNNLGENSQGFGTLWPPVTFCHCSLQTLWLHKQIALVGRLEVQVCLWTILVPAWSCHAGRAVQGQASGDGETRGTCASKDSAPQNCRWSSAWKTPEQQTMLFQWDTQDDAITLFPGTKVRPFCISHQGGSNRAIERWSSKLES